MSLATLSSSILSGLQALGVLRRAVTLAEYCDAIASAVWSYGVDMSRVSSYHGVVARSTAAGLNCLPTHLTTTTFTLGATANPISYYYQGTLVTVSANKTCTLGDGSAGLYFVYFDAATGNIAASKTFPGITNSSNVLIASVTWNGTDYGLVNDERHSYSRNHSWHVWAHSRVGVLYGSGITLAASGTGASATFTTTSGEIADEDIQFAVPASSAFPTANALRTFYQTGASTFAFDKTTSTIPFRAGTGSRPTYVKASDYSLLTMSSAPNRYMNFWIYATSDVHTPIYCFCSSVDDNTVDTNGYTTLAAARAVPWPNLSGYSLSPELRPLYRLVVRADGVVQTLTSEDDYRTVTSLPQGAGTPATTASAVAFTASGSISSTNVQQAIEEVAAEAATTSAGWATAWECDLTALAGQNFKTGGDGSYTVDGKTVTVGNSANASTFDLNTSTAGSGIRIIHGTTGTDYYAGVHTFPFVSFKPSALSAVLGPTHRLRVSVYFAIDADSADTRELIVGVEQHSDTPTTSPTWAMNARFGHISSTSRTFQLCSIFATHYNAPVVGSSRSENVIVCEVPDLTTTRFATGTYSGGWPTEASLLNLGKINQPFETTAHQYPKVTSMTDWRVILGCMQTGTAGGLTVDFKRILVEYKLA